MKRTLGLVAVAALTASFFAMPATAQMINVPVIVSPHGATQRSVVIAGLYARGLNDDSGKLDSYGGAAALHLGGFAIRAGAVSVKDAAGAGSSKITFGGNAEFTFVKSEGSPLKLSGFAGFGTMSDVISLNVPFGIGVSIVPPMEGGTTIEIWGAPRGQLSKLDVTGASNEFGFGFSGGVRVALAMGLGLGVSMDWLNIDLAGSGSKSSSVLFGAGLFYGFQLN